MSIRERINRVRLKRLEKRLKQVNSYASLMASLSDAQLQQQTVLFKERLVQGEHLDDLLPEAFAAMREANKRILGMYPYDVQVLGAIVLHEGDIAEMKTGEGKTLTATLPLYLNALTGKGVLLVTTNDYLAKRDMEEMAPVYRFMGLSVSVALAQAELEKVSAKQKRALYHSDIVYTTNGTLGFDYLGDNLVNTQAKKYMREQFYYAIIDEVDAVLLDAAQTPLVISGSPKVQSNLYAIANDFVQTLVEKDDYQCDAENKNVWLTAKGIQEAEHFFKLDKLYTRKHFPLVRNILLALRAHYIFKKDVDYIVWQDKIILLDAKSGRALHGVSLQAGQHQALEVKEGLKLGVDSRTLASITFQNLFRLFEKLAGMSGTAKDDEDEFLETYGMHVVSIPTHKPIIRHDLPDAIYASLPEKIAAVMHYVRRVHETGQPILLVSGSLKMSELYSELLLREGIAHSVLNARNVAKEALIIQEAGQKGAVTVATAMAGRGTDIKLGAGVAQLGGMVVIGTERMESSRVDWQLRGRAGRQGDPGTSRFFASLEDDIVQSWGPDWVKNYYQNTQSTNKPRLLRANKFKRIINEAQFSSDSAARVSRQNTLQFDESIQVQRAIVYQQRNALLKEEQLSLDISQLAHEVVGDFLAQHAQLTRPILLRYILDNIDYRFTDVDQLLHYRQVKTIQEQLVAMIVAEQANKKRLFADTKQFEQFQRIAILKAIDTCWVEQIDTLQLLKTVVHGRQLAQRQPVYEYHKEALSTYQQMDKAMKQEMIKQLSLSYVTTDQEGQTSIYFA